MRRLWIPTLVLLAGLAPAQEEPSEDARRAPRTKREQRLQQVVDEMIVLVEKHAQLKFPKRPVVRATSHREWREIVQAAMEPANGRELFEASFGTLGLYLADRGEVVLSPLVVAPLVKELGDDPPRHLRERVAHQKATIVHEIVHALQDVHFELPSKLEASEDEDETLRYKFVAEGHAVLIEELIAERELGLEDFMLKGPYAMQADLPYLTGRRYFLHILRTKGMAGVLASLADPPTFDELCELANQPLPPAPQRADEPPDAGRRRDG